MTDLRDDVANIIANEVMKINNAKIPDGERVLIFSLFQKSADHYLLNDFRYMMTFFKNQITNEFAKKPSYSVDFQNISGYNYGEHDHEEDDPIWILKYSNYYKNFTTGEMNYMIDLHLNCEDILFKFSADKAVLNYFSTSIKELTYNKAENYVLFPSDDGDGTWCVKWKVFVNKN